MSFRDETVGDTLRPQKSRWSYKMIDYIEAKNAAGYIKRTSVSQITFRSNVMAALNNDPSVGRLGSYETDWLDGATPELIAFHLEWLFDAQIECQNASDAVSAEHYRSIRLTIEDALESRGARVLYGIDPMDMAPDRKSEIVIVGLP